jgi:glyoxylase-like metal-dependent hydrolase (beta-lactamase superfamily II)
MNARLTLVGASLVLHLGIASAQDARSVLREVSAHMGADDLSCVTYTATGYVGLVGQTYDIRDDWPRVAVSRYSRSVNYDDRSMHEDRVLTQGDYAPRGGGRQPINGERRQVWRVVDDYAWDMQGNEPQPAPTDAERRQLDIWLTPHGFIKAAMAGDPTLITRYEAGALGGLSSTVQRRQRIISVTLLDRYRVNATVNPDNVIERIQTWIPNPVRGDLNYEVEYSDWETFDGLLFPTHFHHHTDWDDETQPPNYNGGHNSLDLRISDVEPNECGPELSVPASVRRATVPPVQVESEQLANGVYYITGGSHHSVAVEFDDFTAVIEAPQNQARALAVIEEVYRLIPNKPLRYVVNTHHHFDHLGGVRTFFHEGATIVAHATNRNFYKQEVLTYAPWTLEPDLLSLHPPTEFAEGYQLEMVDVKSAVTDGSRILEVFYVQSNPHSEGMLMAYLPAERILIEADLFTPGPPGARPPAEPSEAQVALYQNVRAYGLNPSLIAPLHGRTVPWSEFLSLVGED